MNKQEFENLIGKEVEQETFEIYEKMYMAIDCDKQTFVKMLNIKEIPESEDAIQRKIEFEEATQSLRTEIKELQRLVKEKKDNIERYTEYEEISRTKEDKNYWKSAVEHCKDMIKYYKSEIRDYKFRLNLYR